MRKNSGFTLIELLIYLAIFAIAAGLLSGILAVFVRVQSQEAAGAELTQQLSFVQSTVQRLVREAVNIENPAGAASNSLILRMASPALDPTVISSDSDAIYLRQGTGAVNPLTSDRVRVSQFEVVKYENPGAHAVVQLDFSLTYNSQRVYQQITRGLKTSIGRVTAATFDDSLLPNTASNSFTIGNPTYPWRSLTLSNLLNLGQLTADPQSGQQNGSIYYNSVDNAFRGYKNLAWADLGVGWSASGNDIYNTNSGNVGIGINPPQYKLDVTGNFRVSDTSIFSGNATFSGNVGIGTINPAYKLEVNGNVSLGSALYTLGSSAQGGVDSYTKLMLHADGSDQGTSFTDSSSGAKTVTNTETYDSYTKLMLHMEGGGNSFTDSAASKTVTANGDVAQTTIPYLGSKSAVFDGSGDYLSLADSNDWDFGTGDFTVDFWVKFASIGANNALFDLGSYNANAGFSAYATAGNTIQIFTNGGSPIYAPIWNPSTNWHHIAMTRSGTSFRVFVDGTQSGSAVTNSVDIQAGSTGITIGDSPAGADPFGPGLNGWIDEFRVSKGIARWTANFTPPSSPYGKVYTVTGTKKFGTASGLFDGSGSYLSLADSADWDFWDADFTIDFWVRFNNKTGYQHFFQHHQDGSSYIEFFKEDSDKLQFRAVTGGVWKGNYITTSAPTINNNTWYHVAFVRNGNTPYIFLDGTSLSLYTWSSFATLGALSGNVYIGSDMLNGSPPPISFLNGYLDELRVSKGLARWTSNFTPPSVPYDSGTPGSTNVGIGTASPGYLLEVNGTLQAADFYSGDGTQGLTNSTSYWLCTDATCTAKCQATIKDGLITGCP